MGLAPDVEYVATWYLVGVGIGILPFFLNYAALGSEILPAAESIFSINMP